jgi:hypothetical protein
MGILVVWSYEQIASDKPWDNSAWCDMSDERTIIDEFENVLGVPFKPHSTKKISIDVPTARHLAQAVNDFYHRFRLPDKDRGEIRPYLFHGYTTGKKSWRDFVNYEGYRYAFNAAGRYGTSQVPKTFLVVFTWSMFFGSITGSARLFSGIVA